MIFALVLVQVSGREKGENGDKINLRKIHKNKINTNEDKERDG